MNIHAKIKIKFSLEFISSFNASSYSSYKQLLISQYHKKSKQLLPFICKGYLAQKIILFF